MNLIVGSYKPSGGSLAFNGVDLAQSGTHERSALGIARTFQNIHLFANLSKWQNVWAAGVVRDSGWAGLRKRWLSSGHAAHDEVQELLTFSGLAGKADVLVGNLAFGEQRRLELARTATSGAELLLLDEPAAGMNAEEIDEIDELDDGIRSLRDQDRTVVVTGAALGIGQAFALESRAHGANVVLADIGPADETVQLVRQAGGQALSVQTDVSDAASVDRMAQQAVNPFGCIDGLINNAAYFREVKLIEFEQIDPALWDRIFAVNVKGVWHCCKAVMPAM